MITVLGLLLKSSPDRLRSSHFLARLQALLEEAEHQAKAWQTGAGLHTHTVLAKVGQTRKSANNRLMDIYT